MAAAPSLGIAFVGALALCVMLVQWLGLVDRPKWAEWLTTADNAAATRYQDRREVFGKLVDQRITARGMTAAELAAALPHIAAERIAIALRSLSRGPLPLLCAHVEQPSTLAAHLMSRRGSTPSRVPRSQMSALRKSTVTYYTLCSMPRLRARVLTHAAAVEGLPRRAAAALANGAGAISDYFYRLFDLCVALVLFVFITLLTLLPLHEAQSLLLFNSNFWRVIQRGMRNRDFVEGLAS